MREIRSRISERHGVDLTSQQIQELAARRLEAILDPRAIKPSLMDELRRAAGLPADAGPSESESEDTVDESALYTSDSGFVRFMRRLLNPLLKLLFNPTVLVDALNHQLRGTKAVAAREAEQRRRQTEWNALHFEVLRRLVTDIVRTEIDNQHLAQRVESLAAKVDFNERRVRGFEQNQHQTRPVSRPLDAPVVSPVAAPPKEEHPATEAAPSDAASPEGGRRRRRRRRGRRSGQPRDISGVPTPDVAGATPVDQSAEGDEFGDDEATPDDLIEDTSVASMLADEPPLVEMETSSPPPFDPPRPEEPLRVATSELDHATSELDQAPTADSGSSSHESAESAERPDPATPEHS